MNEKGELVHEPISNGAFNRYLAEKYSDVKKVVLIDENVNEIWGENLITGNPSLNGAEIIVIPAGEENKSLEICSQIWSVLLEYNISRNDVIINIGGGVTTDLGGFIASTYKRGLRFINVPTTLMAQVDASCGGKTGIDHEDFKNVIGTFSMPEKVFVDPDFLNTLPNKEIKSGFAEMLKHGLIADEKHWNDLLQTDLKLDLIKPLIPYSVAIKEKVVKKDFTEAGLRKILNFGHTIGHAFETYFITNKQDVTHGEAVGWGMICETKLSVFKGLLATELGEALLKNLTKYYPLPFKESFKVEALFKLMLNDKKNTNDEVNMVLLKGIGEPVVDVKVEEQEIVNAINSVYLTFS